MASRWVGALVAAAALTVAGSAIAQPCPVPSQSGQRGARPRDRGARRATDIAVQVLEAIFAGAAEGASEESAPGSGDGSGDGGSSFRWPAGVGARFDGTFGSVNLADADFAGAELGSRGVLTTGSALRLDRTELAGGEIAVDLVPTRFVRMTMGAGLYWPVGQMGTFDDAALGRGGEVESLMVIKPFAEVGIALRGTVFDPFVVAHAGWLLARADVRGECGCSYSFEASRFVIGPRAGLRAYLLGPLFVEASLFMDVARLPDWVGALGVGLGRRSG